MNGIKLDRMWQVKNAYYSLYTNYTNGNTKRYSTYSKEEIKYKKYSINPKRGKKKNREKNETHINQKVNYQPEPNYSKIHQEEIIIINTCVPNNRDSRK